jgi:HPt (histidine-containing phosphotransfer) domain-containing protein
MSTQAAMTALKSGVTAMGKPMGGGVEDFKATEVIDRAYLEDMKEFVGTETLAGLIDDAPGSFRREYHDLEAGWRRGDAAAVHEFAHRLKGAAGSIGAARLSAVAHLCQQGPLCDAATLARLAREIAAAETALADYLAALAR